MFVKRVNLEAALIAQPVKMVLCPVVHRVPPGGSVEIPLRTPVQRVPLANQMFVSDSLVALFVQRANTVTR